MTISPLEQAEELLIQAYELDEYHLQIPLLEQAVRIADSLDHLELAMEARLEYITATIFSGSLDRGFTAFIWCVTQYDKEPERFFDFEFSIFWAYKIILHNVHQIPDLSLERAEKMLNQMFDYFQKSGYSVRPYYYLRCLFYLNTGQKEKAQENFEKVMQLPRTEMDDCLACESGGFFRYYKEFKQPEKCIEVVQPVLDGMQSCAEEPHRTYSDVLRPLALLGRVEEADKYQAKGYKLIQGNQTFLEHHGLQIAFLTHRNKLTKAFRIFERHIQYVLSTFEHASKYHFLVASKLLFEARSRKAGTKVKLVLPAEFPLHDPANEYQVSTVLEWLENEVKVLGERFNKRNGNQYYTTTFIDLMDYKLES